MKTMLIFLAMAFTLPAPGLFSQVAAATESLQSCSFVRSRAWTGGPSVHINVGKQMNVEAFQGPNDMFDYLSQIDALACKVDWVNAKEAALYLASHNMAWHSAALGRYDQKIFTSSAK